MKNMNTFIISLIILVGLLFVGIVILINPTSFAPRLTTSQMPPPTQPLAGTIVPREIIMVGSALTVTGLVGLAILGFRVFKESEDGQIRK
jgi:hypothetical protein